MRRLGAIFLPRYLRQPPLLTHLVVFALIVLIPALLFSAFLIVQFSDQQQEIAAAQVNDTAEIVSNAVDREVYAMLTTGRILANAPSLERGNLEAFRAQASAALEGTGMGASLVDRDDNVIFATDRFVAGNESDADGESAIARAFETGRSQVSGVYYDEASERFMFHVAVPLDDGGDVARVLAINRSAEALSNVIADRDLPSRWTAIIADTRGRRVFAVATEAGEMTPKSGISYDNPSILETVGGELSDDLIEATTYSVLSGWRTTVAVPNAVIVRPAVRSWLLLISVGTLLLLFSVALGVIFGRNIARPIRKLSHQAEAIGAGEPAATISTDIAEISEVSKILAQASRDRREAEEQNRFLMREMTHRAKNQYALIAAIARRAAKESADTTQFLATLSEALNSLARSAELLSGRGWDSAHFADLAKNQLSAFGCGAESDQFRLDGPAVAITPAASQTIGLALHELATNAAKYGALSVDSGRVHLDWSLDGETFCVVWREVGGPPVVQPSRSGFGTLVTQRMTSRGLGGSVDMDYAPDGVVWTLRAPRETVCA